MMSKVTLAEVRRWDPQGLDAAARALLAARDKVEELRARLRAARPDEARWQGVAAERARAAHDAREGQLRAMAERLGEVVPVFTGAADATGELLEELRYWDGVAAETGYTISHGGEVIDSADRGDDTPAQSPAEAEDRNTGAVQIRTGLDRVMERAAQIDAAILTAMQDGLPLPGSGSARPTPSVPEPMAGPGPVRGFSGRDFMVDLPTTFPDRQPVAPPAPTPPAHPGTTPSNAAAEATTPHPPPAAVGPATDGASRSDVATAAVFDPAVFDPAVFDPAVFDRAAVAGEAAHREVEALHAWAAGGGGPETVVRSPDPRTGTHDSLWRIAARELGDSTRWPEIFALNRGDPQPGGRHLEQPGLIFPGEHLRLPTTPARPPAAHPDNTDGGNSASPSSPTVTPHPDPGFPTSAEPSAPPRTSDPSPTATPRPTDPTPSTSPALPTESTPTSPSVLTTGSSPSTVGAPDPSSPTDPTGPGVSIGPEVFVGAGLGVALVAGLLWARRGHRTGPPAGTSGDDGDTAATGPRTPPVQPSPSSATSPGPAGGGRRGPGMAAGRGSPVGQATVDVPTRPALSATPTAPVPRPASDEATAAATRWPTRLPVGARDGREIAFDLATVPGLGVDGPGAAAAVRGLTVNALGVNLLTGTPDAPPPVTVVITGEDLGDLLDHHAVPAEGPAGLQVLDSLEDVLDLAEATVHARTTDDDDVDDPMSGSTLVLVTPPPPRALTGRLQAVLITGQACGVVGMVWGEWRGGASVHTDGDGLVGATDRGPGDGLRGVRLYGLGAAEVPDLLALLDSLGSGSPAPPAALYGTLPAAPPQALAAPTAPTTAAAASAGGTAGPSDDTGKATTPTHPTPHTDGQTLGDTDPGRVADVDRGGRSSSTAEDVAARIASAVEPDAPASAVHASTVHTPVAPPVRAVAPVDSLPEASDARAAQPDQSAPGLRLDDGDPTGESTGDSTGDSTGQDTADPHLVSDAVPPTVAPGGVGDVKSLSSACPITLRILGRPTLLVERPTAAATPAGDGVHAADSVEPDGHGGAVEGIDAAGAVEVTATLSARMRDLLVYLAVHPDGVRRDTAVAELWPDTGRNRPGNNLSSLISRLRSTVRAAVAATPDAAPSAGPDGGGADRVGPIVLVEGDRYRLDDTRIAVDYWSFLTDAATTGAASPSPTPRPAVDDAVLARWQRAHELYRGSLAEGVDHAWILSVREATRRSFLTVTARLVRHYVGTDPAAALAILETVRNLEPTNQSVYRDIMALQLRLGDNDAAAATLRLLENQLADVEESLDDATQALARAILE